MDTILAVSLERWGAAGRARYAALLVAGLRSIARGPRGSMTRDRSELANGLRSCHLRRPRRGRGVKTPVHVVYYRLADPGVIEIVRVLHERMDPGEHLG